MREGNSEEKREIKRSNGKGEEGKGEREGRSQPPKYLGPEPPLLPAAFINV